MNYFFIARSGQVLSTQAFINGNVLGATAQAIFLGYGDWVRGKMMLKGILDFEVERGLFSRWHTRLENTAVDDYLCMACIPDLAKRILEHGRKTRGFFDVFSATNPPQLSKKVFTKDFWRPWLWRHFGFWNHARYAAGESIGIIGQILWAGSLFLTARFAGKKQDPWIQGHLMCLVYIQAKKPSKLCDLAWQYFMRKKPQATYKIVSEYIGCGYHPGAHPLVDAWRARRIGVWE